MRGLARLLLPALLPVCALAVYVETLGHPFQYDDRWNLVENTNVELARLDLPSLRRAVYLHKKSVLRPLSNLGFGLSYYVGGRSPRAFRLVNLGLHALNSLLVFFLLRATARRLARRRQEEAGRTDPQPPAAPPSSLWPGLGALLWAVHPVHTSAVIYIHQRMVLQASCFMLLALLAYGHGREHPRRRRLAFFACGLCFVLGLLSKEIALLLLPALCLYEWTVFRSPDRGSAPKLLVGLGLTVGLGLFALTVYGSSWLTGLQGRPDVLGLRLLTQCRVLGLYILLLFFPHPSLLNIDHAFALSRSLLEPWTTLPGLLLPLSLLALLVFTWRRRAWAACLGLGWLLLMLSLEAPVHVTDVVAEYRLYLASLAPLFLLLPLPARLTPRGRALLACGLLAAALFGAAWTRERGRVWSTPLQLWADAAAKNPDSPRPRLHHGLALLHRGDHAEALPELEAADRMLPLLETRVALARCLFALGRREDSRAKLDGALAMEAKNARERRLVASGLRLHGELGLAYSLVLPDSSDVRSRAELGLLALLRRRPARALYWAESGVARYPDQVDLRLVLARIYATLGRRKDALREMTVAEGLAPQPPAFYRDRAQLLLDAGLANEARAILLELLDDRPDDARVLRLLADACELLGERAEADAYLRRAGIDAEQRWRKRGERAFNRGDFPEAVRCLREAYARSGGREVAVQLAAALLEDDAAAEAERLCRELLRADPGFAKASGVLGLALARGGRYREAIPHFEAALRASPQDARALHNLRLCREKAAEQE